VNDVLEALAKVPGVRFTALVTEDGVPVAVPGRPRGLDLAKHTKGTDGAVDEIDGCAAVSVGWLDEVTRLVAALSWDSPHRVTLKAARGTMILLRTSGAVLVAVLEAGLDPEELKLSMDGVSARIQRVLRGMNRNSASDAGKEDEPPAALPGADEATKRAAGLGLSGSWGGRDTTAGR
jgi:predicted regulator of Ras-like GTPase activity (Roadblock/LC7/MglB family)